MDIPRVIPAVLLASAMNLLWIPQRGPELRAETEDPVLEGQIAKLAETLKSVYQEIGRHQRALKTETNKAKKATLNTELRNLRKQRDGLEALLHELSEQAQATSPTKMDELADQARSFDRRQERLNQREEAVRDVPKKSP